ncbi:MAG TPA: glycosyltransferase family 1 protein [Reyranella sp.]|nr:glycosyltransferase family 1 protein [Reyranella sp.]
MKVRQPLNLFFEEVDPDRWLPFDRYPRRVVRFLVRGPARASGARRVFLNLAAGLDRIGVPYRVNDFGHIKSNQEDLVCLIGQPHLLRRFENHTPMMFGTALYNHPVDDEHLPRRHMLRQVLVPSDWVKRMFSKAWPDIVSVWPVGIDTDRWTPSVGDSRKAVDVVVYEKLFRDGDRFRAELVKPMMEDLRRRGLSVEYLRYGSYREGELLALSQTARSMIYLSPHETQGIALEQMLSANVPVMAWDPGGDWQSLEYLLRGVRYGPVTTVPYWDERCGEKFTNTVDFGDVFSRFWRGVETGAFAPRQMIFDKGLTLEASAAAYVALADKNTY